MTKLEIEAIKKLPDEFIADGTLIERSNGYVVAATPNHGMIIYENGAWRKMADFNSVEGMAVAEI